ncbi:MAG: glycine zipper family protein [Maricaulaceae bacterium]
MTSGSHSRLTLITIGCLALPLSACAGSGASYRPIIDTPITAQYETDLQNCQSLAAERQLINGDTQTSMLRGAATGGVFGLLERGDDGDNFLTGALIGGAIGGISGAFETNGERKYIVRNCMSGRGYRVIG